MVDSHSSRDYSDVVSRRKFVSLAGATGAAAVAGCTGGGGGDDGDGGGDSDGGDSDGGDSDGGEGETGGETYDYEHEDIWFETAQPGDFPVDAFQYNTTTGWNLPHLTFGVFAQWTTYHVNNDEFIPHLIQDWEHTEDNSFVMTMSEEFTWGTTGDSITAEDLVLQLEIQENVGDPLFDFVEDYEASDEFELTLSYPDDVRPDFVTYSALDREAAFAPSIWEDERDSESPTEVDVPVPDPSGPLAITARESNYHQAEPRNNTDEYEDDAVAGDHFNWNGYRDGYRQDNNACHQSFIAGELDGIHSLFAPPDITDEFPDTVQQYQFPAAFGMGIWPDHTSEPWNVREVRQALYYSIDRNAVIENVGETTKVSHHPAPTGLTYATVGTYLGSEEPEGFTVYSLDQEQAESLLDEAGYEMGDISTTMEFPAAWSDWAIAAQAVVEQLQSVGWDISGNGNSEGPGSYAANVGDGFGLAVDQHTESSGTANIPYFSLRYILRNELRDSQEHFAGYTKDEVEIDGETINIDETLDALSTATDQSEREDLIRDLALIVNKDVPVLYVMEKYQQSWIDTDRFDAPSAGETDQAAAEWPLWWFPQVDEKLETASEDATPGLLKARTE